MRYPEEFIRVAARAERIFLSPASWETKFELIFALLPLMEEAGCVPSWTNPDMSYEEDVRAFMDAVLEKRNQLCLALDLEPEAQEDVAENILGCIRDAVLVLIAYDRRESEILPQGVIEEAILCGEITVEQMVSEFAASLRAHLP